MKKSIMSLVLLLVATCGWAQKVWETPTSFCDGSQYGSIKVCKVDFFDKETVVHLNVRHIDVFQLGKGIYIETPDGNEYYSTGVKATCEEETDFPLEKMYRPTSSYTNIALHFEPLPAGVERFHLIESSKPYALKIWNIAEGKAKDMSEIFNSNWRDDLTGDWKLGLYPDNAVYNCKVWKYESKDEKKVVLTDGQEKVTIAIGKEKAGKRQFTINGQKVTLSSFGSVLPAYPIEDNTAFSTEYKDGEAVITGWIKDLPKDLSDKGVNLVANVMNLVIWGPPNTSTASFDESGQFTMSVKLNCVQTVRFTEIAGKNVVFAKNLVLEPGKKYYMVHDWKNGCCLFMGENARLQNELMANPYDYPYVEANGNSNFLNVKALKKFKDEFLEKFSKTNDRLNEIIAQHPTISKRYRDYVSESNRFGAGSAILSTWIAAQNARLPEEVEISARKLGTIDPAMPLSLTNDFARYINHLIINGEKKMNKRYKDNPDLYLSLEQKGMLKLSDKDRDILNKWKARIGELERNDTLGGKAWWELYMAMDGKYCSNGDFRELRDREDVKAAYNQYAPSMLKQAMMIVDSISTDANIRDFCMARALFLNIHSTKQPLNVEGLALLNDINNSYFKDLVAQKNEEMTKDVEDVAAKADARILSVSLVEGLEDGKAILDKIVEPYKGKIIYLDVWGVGCGGCMKYLEQSHEIKEQLKDYDIVYLYLSAEKNIGSWKYYITKYGLTSPNCVHYNLPRKQFSAVEDYIEETGIPAYRLFDKEGNIIKLKTDHWMNMDAFKKQIDELSKK